MNTAIEYEIFDIYLQGFTDEEYADLFRDFNDRSKLYASQDKAEKDFLKIIEVITDYNKKCINGHTPDGYPRSLEQFEIFEGRSTNRPPRPYVSVQVQLTHPFFKTTFGTIENAEMRLYEIFEDAGCLDLVSDIRSFTKFRRQREKMKKTQPRV